jgi:hydroxyacylglutathione hydrolase
MLIIEPIPAFSDNYIWLLREPSGCVAAVVDPGDEEPVQDRLAKQGLRLSAILITHHHSDHTGGVQGLVAAWPGVGVFGPADRRIPDVTRPLGEGDELGIPGMDASFRVMEVPGHTSSHIAFLGEGSLFCGDTLFAAGCGRVFDGTFEQLAASLERIARLPPETCAYCAHEYTLANLGFAAWVEPDSAALAERTAHVRRLRDSGRPSVPSFLAEELETNPFLRVKEEGVRAAAERFAGHSLASPAAVFTALRRWKDQRYD